jgi:hypothetical protein
LARTVVLSAAVFAAIEIESVPADSIKGDPDHWTLDFAPRTPQRIELTKPDGTKEAYWYFLYVVTNNTGEARNFAPAAVCLTEHGKVAHDGIYLDVLAAVQKQYHLDNLKNSIGLLGSLKAGTDEAQQGIFIFPEVDPTMKKFQIFVVGLSSEFVLRDVPGPKPEDKPTVAVLRKTMELDLACPGLDPSRGLDKCYLSGQKWIWR